MNQLNKRDEVTSWLISANVTFFKLKDDILSSLHKETHTQERLLIFKVGREELGIYKKLCSRLAVVVLLAVGLVVVLAPPNGGVAIIH